MADPRHPRRFTGGVQAADRAVVRERQAGDGDRDGVRHLAFHPAPVGAGPQRRLDQGRRQPRARAERADRIAEARPPVGDGGGCFRTSGAGIRTRVGVMRSDAGRCPISSQCGILGVAKSTCYWMLDRPETEWADPHGEDVGRVWRDGDRSAEDSCHKGGKSGLTRRLLNHPIRLFPQ